MIKVLDSDLVMRFGSAGAWRRVSAMREREKKFHVSMSKAIKLHPNFPRRCRSKRIVRNRTFHLEISGGTCLAMATPRLCLQHAKLKKKKLASPDAKCSQSIWSDCNCETLIGRLSHTWLSRWVTSLPTTLSLHFFIRPASDGTCVTNQSLDESIHSQLAIYVFLPRAQQASTGRIWHAATAAWTSEWVVSFTLRHIYAHLNQHLCNLNVQ